MPKAKLDEVVKRYGMCGYTWPAGGRVFVCTSTEPHQETMVRTGQSLSPGTLHTGADTAVVLQLHELFSHGDASPAGAAKKLLVEGLKYHEHDGHNMPKSVAREALEALGMERDKQP